MSSAPEQKGWRTIWLSVDFHVLALGGTLLVAFCTLVSLITFAPCEPPILKTAIWVVGAFVVLLMPRVAFRAYDRTKVGEPWKCYFLTNLALTAVLGVGAACFFLEALPRPKSPIAVPAPPVKRP